MTTGTDIIPIKMIADHIALVTINRPDARNAVNADVAKGLEHAVDETEKNPDIWTVILTGAGDKAFCAGADLKAISQGGASSLMTERGGFAGFVYRKRTKPWIAALNGFTLAGGCEIALSCDLIVAVEEAAFGLPEVMRGLIAGAGGIFRLPRALPKAIALELIMTGGQITAKQALHFGMINRLVPRAQLMDEALKLAGTICANAPIAVRESRKIALEWVDKTEDELRKLTDDAFAMISKTEDFKEGPRAFVEKRAPKWTGR